MDMKRIKEIAMYKLMRRIDRDNYGMLPPTHRIEPQGMYHVEHVRIENNTVYAKNTPVYKVERRFAQRKTQGCYKELKPKLIKI